MKKARDTYLRQLSSQFLLPYGQWIIAIGATIIAIGLTINASLAKSADSQKPPL